MKKPIKTYESYQVVVVPFPFIDSTEVKKRPAVILSSETGFNRHSSACVMAMITSAMHSPWPCDVEINDLSAAGLPVKSIIRMKLFTIDQRLILGQLGTLSKHDQKNLAINLKALFKI